MSDLTAGSRLGPYEIVSRIGGGGMGEVFRARDTRLDRTVAIKVLPRDFATDVHLRLRFEREAKAISQLNHPHICTLHDIGHENEIDYLVMELIEGESLADRLSRGPLPLELTLRYGTQIAEALQRAHAAGLVHRDLKPGNIMITKTGAKLLDFGLAKSTAISSAPAQASTALKPLTAEGTIVGTIQYMAPEQIEAGEADPRTDLFALGLVLYEMVTGRRAFDGKTKTSVIAAIVAGEPAPVSQLQPLIPASLEKAINRCIRKDPDDRWQCAADLKAELLRIQDEPAQGHVRKRAWLPWAIAAAAALIGAATATVAIRRTASPRVVRFNVGPPPGWTFAMDYNLGPVAVSPDGRFIAFTARDDVSGVLKLWVRDLAETQPVALAGTEGGSFVFWSPDSKSLGFFADGYLKRIDLSGGAPQVLCPAAFGRGGTWSQNNEIVFSPAPGGSLYRVSATGGAPRQLTRLNAARGESTHRWPTFLPDGRHFLFMIRSPSTAEQNGDAIYASSVDDPEPHLVLSVSSNVAYAEPGYLLYVRDQTLFAQRFNLHTLQVEGSPQAVSRGPMQYHPAGFGLFGCSRNGVLAYASGTRLSTLVWVDRSGKIEPAIAADADYLAPRVSPDGQQILYGLPESTSGNQDQWLFDTQRRVARRITFHPRDDFAAAITPDGKNLIFSSNRSGTPNTYIKAIDSPEERLLVGGSMPTFVESVSPDGRTLLFRTLTTSTQNDIYAVSISGGSPAPLVASRFNDIQPTFSPTGRWVAYASDESGRYEVYVTTYPRSAVHIQVSTDGGTQPTWRGDEKELFYIGPGDRLMAVPMAEAGGALKPGIPVFLADVPLRPSRNDEREYDVTNDGKRFLMNDLPRDRRAMPITVVLNWQHDLTSK